MGSCLRRNDDQDGFSTTVVFARLPFPQTAQVLATADEAVLVDMWGEQTRLQPQDGLFTIELPAAVCTQPIGDYCMIGGLTYYVVQATTGDLPETLPAPGYSPTRQPFPTPTVVSEEPTVVSEQSTVVSEPSTATSQSPIPNLQSPTPNLQSPTPNPQSPTPNPPPPTTGYWLIGGGVLLLLLMLFLFVWRRR